MYAKISTDESYHLLDADAERTLCGLSVVPIIIDRPIKASALHLTSSKPSGLKLCGICAESDDGQDVEESALSQAHQQETSAAQG